MLLMLWRVFGHVVAHISVLFIVVRHYDQMHAIVREACEIYDESVVTLLNQQFKR